MSVGLISIQTVYVYVMHCRESRAVPVRHSGLFDALQMTQEAKLSPRDRAMLRVTEYFAKSLK